MRKRHPINLLDSRLCSNPIFKADERESLADIAITADIDAMYATKSSKDAPQIILGRILGQIRDAERWVVVPAMRSKAQGVVHEM